MTDVNFADFGHQLGVQLGVGDLGGGILISLIFMCILLFPVLLLTKRSPGIPSAIVGIGSLSACVAFGWLPVWVLLVTALIVFAMIAGKARDWISGRGEGSG